MNREEYVAKRNELVAQIKIEGKKCIPRDNRLDNISKCYSLFWNIFDQFDLLADLDVQAVQYFWRLVYQQHRMNWGVVPVISKTVDEIISEFPKWKDHHQKLADKYYLQYECVEKYIDMIVQLGYLDLVIPAEVKEPDC